MHCINCQEHKHVEIINGIGICKDPECIFIHNTLQPTICACCGDTLSTHIIHEYCQSSKIRNRVYLKSMFKAFNRYQEMGDISING